jgi:PIN domain nuclease of toxin-antitoxin system
MSALLDTHALVWAVGTPDRLSGAAHAQIEDPGNELFVSSATAWELATKFRLGKFPEAETLVRRYAPVLEELGAQELPIDAAHALRAGSLRWPHRDPFDRMLVAQAMIENMALVSRDRVIGALTGLAVVW